MPVIIESGLADIYYRALETGEVQEGPSFAYNDPEGLPAFYDVRVGRVDSDTVAIYYSNVTVRERQLQDLREANKALKQSNEELERFSAVVSHDLQAPLRTIQGFLGLLQEECAGQLDETGQMFVKEAMGGAHRLDTTVKGLLEIAQLGTTKHREAVDLNVMLEELSRDLSISLRNAQGTLTIGEMPTLLADPGQLRQLFQNLLLNYFRYRRPGVPLQINIRAALRADEWLFSIEDNGICVAPKHSKRIFEMFQRLHREDEIEGLGLGLSICQRVVEGHGGTLWLAPSPPPGATFCFTLPTPEATPEDRFATLRAEKVVD